MRTSILLLILFINCLSFSACQIDPEIVCPRVAFAEPTGPIQKICFGSCGKETKEQPILNTIVNDKPDLFIYLGDNIYGDTKDMSVLKAKYNKLGCKTEFQNLFASCRVLATWDDHDYGQNDAGMNYPMKNESKEIFLDFWKEPIISDRRNHEGIYTSHYYGDDAHKVQIILLDCRTFRSDLKSDINGYAEDFDSNSTMLGTAQWQWLEEELQKPAVFRIICSSTQFARTHIGYEAWANMPLQVEKMKNLISSTHANGVVFISGDIHLAELSKLDNAGSYPIYDMTSSGLTQLEKSNPTNGNRIGDLYDSYNYGILEFDWTNSDPSITLGAKDIQGNIVIQKKILLSEISH
ncbi:MAG: alkaline phosphatase D family protein [Bacteroidota bacterium]